jgi:hypothetical protein
MLTGLLLLSLVTRCMAAGLSTTLNPTQTHVSNYTSGTPYYAAQEVSAASAYFRS